ncbi:hypothetical protein GCM10017673_39270 [Streptosporangium violaceochromogenes]|nr:hypothetical protein GCM10017673_39270 [Streptosporangium violaceochromogenes]
MKGERERAGVTPYPPSRASRPELGAADDCPAVRAAERLRSALTRQGITADVHGGYGLALVSVWTGLIVWSNGDRYWWCAGWHPQERRPAYASARCGDPEQAALRVARRYARLRALHPPAPRLSGEPM